MLICSVVRGSRVLKVSTETLASFSEFWPKMVFPYSDNAGILIFLQYLLRLQLLSKQKLQIFFGFLNKVEFVKKFSLMIFTLPLGWSALFWRKESMRCFPCCRDGGYTCWMLICSIVRGSRVLKVSWETLASFSEFWPKMVFPYSDNAGILIFLQYLL